ncbi:MAG: sugar ABC transporter permease [Elusimicrobia bacterium]|nr:sugar ABC transporter permease [Elusimicrobiota bacterium]
MAVSAVFFPLAAVLLCRYVGLVQGAGSGELWAWFFITQVIINLFFKHIIKGRFSLPYMLLAPAFVGLALLLVYPFVFQIYLSFHDLKLTTIMAWKNTGHLPFVGIQQYINVFTTSPLSEVSFWALLLRTVWWTFINVFFHVTGGFALALLLNNNIRFKGIYRTLLVIPWAMPQVVAVLAMRGEFHSQYGFVNIMLGKLAVAFPALAAMGFGPVQWLSDHPLATCTLINIWLGIPFMMVVILGGLQSISSSYYDAADIDGASYFQKLRYITVPLIRPVLMPAVTLGTVWTFNNINVIYLVTGQSGGTERADILVSALYKAAFTYNRYSYSAAFAIVIFAILFFISVFYLKTFDAAKDER